MGFLNKFLLGDLPHAVQVGAVTVGRRRHRSTTRLKAQKQKEKLTLNLHFGIE